MTQDAEITPEAHLSYWKQERALRELRRGAAKDAWLNGDKTKADYDRAVRALARADERLRHWHEVVRNGEPVRGPQYRRTT